LNAYQAQLDDLRTTRRDCLINHLALLGCDVGPPRWGNWLADPEVVVAHQLHAGRDDATIPQEIGSWLVQYGDLFSMARLTAIGPSDDIAWRTVVAGLEEHARPWRGRDIDFLHPSTARLQLRGLLGPGSRAEICIALASTDMALTGSDIARRTGFRPQQINRELRTMLATGWVIMRADGTSKHYRPLRISNVVEELPGAVAIDWPDRLSALSKLIELLEDLTKSDGGRGALIDAFDKLSLGVGTTAGFWESPNAGPLEERVLELVRERHEAIRSDW
jgi:hypothetical protein